MDDGRTALLFFYGIFWAAALAAITEFRAFDTAAWFRRRERPQVFYRFGVGVLVANFLPVLLLWFLYSGLLPDGSRSVTAILAAAIASLSVFFIPRLMHAALATSATKSWFYTDDDWKEVVRDAKAKTEDHLLGHLLPALGYLLAPVSIAKILVCLAPS